MKYFHPILDKKDPPEDKELLNPSGPLSKVIPSSSIASCNAGAESSETVCYTKLTPAIVGSHTSLLMWKPRTAVVKENEYISWLSRPHDNSTIIFIFSGANENLTQLVKVCSSNFLTCLILQISSDFSTIKVLCYTVLCPSCKEWLMRGVHCSNNGQ